MPAGQRRRRPLRRSAAGAAGLAAALTVAALTAAALLAAAVGLGGPDAGAAPAAVGPATAVATATATMTATPDTESAADAACPAGTVLVGGGAALAPADAAAAGNGLKLDGTLPSGAGSWSGVGGFGGAADPDDVVTADAVCATGPVGPTREVSFTAAGFGPVTATCPAGTSLTGGGGQSAPAADGSLKVIASYPSDAAGDAVGPGSADPGSWSVEARSSAAGGPSDPYAAQTTTTADALCSTTAVATVVVGASAALTTATGGAAQSATVACPAGDVLLDGGVTIDSGAPAADPAPSQFGVHLTADDVVAPGVGASPDAWTATAHTGGLPATVAVHVLAVCAVPAAPVPVATTAPTPPSSTVPAGPTGRSAGTSPGPPGSSAGRGSGRPPTAPTGTAAGVTTTTGRPGATRPSGTRRRTVGRVARPAPAGGRVASSARRANGRRHPATAAPALIPAPTVPPAGDVTLGSVAHAGAGPGVWPWVAAALAVVVGAALLGRRPLLAAGAARRRRRPPRPAPRHLRRR